MLDESYREPEFLLKYSKKQSAYTYAQNVTAIYSEFTDDKFAAFRKIFSGKCILWSDDTETLNIIYEETDAYFSGSASLDDTVKMINDRVNTRINE